MTGKRLDWPARVSCGLFDDGFDLEPQQLGNLVKRELGGRHLSRHVVFFGAFATRRRQAEGKQRAGQASSAEEVFHAGLGKVRSFTSSTGSAEPTESAGPS